MEEAIAIVTKYRDNVLGMSMCEQIQRAVLNSILEDLHNAQQSFAPDPETGGAKSENKSTPTVSGRTVSPLLKG